MLFGAALRKLSFRLLLGIECTRVEARGAAESVFGLSGFALSRFSRIWCFKGCNNCLIMNDKRTRLSNSLLHNLIQPSLGANTKLCSTS